MKKLHWTQRPGAKKKLKEASRKARQTRINQKIAATDEEFDAEELDVYCHHCGKEFASSSYRNTHEKKYCKSNPRSEVSLKIADNHTAYLDIINKEKKSKRFGIELSAATAIRLQAIQNMVEELAHGEILAVDQSKNRMIVSVPIEIPLQEIGVGRED